MTHFCVVEVIVVARCHPGALTAVVAAVAFQPARQWAGRLASQVVYGRRAAVLARLDQAEPLAIEATRSGPGGGWSSTSATGGARSPG